MKTAGITTAGLSVLLLIAGCGKSAEEKAAEAAASRARASELAEMLVAKVRYEVGGDTTQASITAQTPTGTTQQSDIDVPLRTKGGGTYLEYSFTSGDFVYLSAQNSKGYGTVTCRITTDSGEVISENMASGGYSIATCKGKAK